MAKQNRLTLKNFFTDGALPSAGMFGELIDSTLNMKDEGFSKSPEYGFEISTLGKSTGLISFFRDSQPVVPLWSITLEKSEQENRIFIGASAAARESLAADAEQSWGPTLTLSPNGWVGVNTASPGCELEVNGTLRCAARLGTVPQRQLSAGEAGTEQQEGALVDLPVPADGKWHTITPALTGCEALEVVAGVGKKDHGRYALLHAIALNTYNPKRGLFNFFGLKNRIKGRQAYYRSRSDKLVLRWTGEQRRYFLQIRTNSDYGLGPHGTPIRITYHITRLWDDPRMTSSWDVKADSQ